jgi:hypothetical protein
MAAEMMVVSRWRDTRRWRLFAAAFTKSESQIHPLTRRWWHLPQVSVRLRRQSAPGRFRKTIVLGHGRIFDHAMDAKYSLADKEAGSVFVQ